MTILENFIKQVDFSKFEIKVKPINKFNREMTEKTMVITYEIKAIEDYNITLMISDNYRPNVMFPVIVDGETHFVYREFSTNQDAIDFFLAILKAV